MELSTAVAQVAAIGTEVSEQAVLQRLVEAAQALTPARYAVALLVGPAGTPTALAHRGMSAPDVAALPHLPRPVGLVGLVLAGHTLNLAHLADHPASVGFPTGHVPMGPLLGLPISVNGRVQGGLYVTRSPGEAPFTDHAQHLATALAIQTGTATAALRGAAAAQTLIDGLGLTLDQPTATPHSDGPSPAVRRILTNARAVLNVDLTFLSRIDGDRQTFTTVDSEPGAPALPEGLSGELTDGYCGLMLDGRIPAAVPDLATNPLTADLAVTTALGVGAYCGVPVRRPDGSLYGTLCGLHGTATRAPSSAQLQAMGTIAGLLGQRLAQEEDYAAHRAARRAEFAPLLTGERLAVAVQPIVDLTTGKPVGFEALARITDTTGANRRPDHVFAEAAQLGLGIRLEHAAAQTALRLLPDLPAGTYLSINLSPHAMCDPGTYDLLCDLPLDRIVVELTEHDQVTDYPTIVHALAGLRARGLRLAIDDAGSGFAGLQHLAELHPDLIKLDIAFVHHIDIDPARRAVARALIGFAAEVDATLIAEGIETPAELDQLHQLGAPLGQGFLLGRPASPALMFAGISANRRTPARAWLRTEPAAAR